MNFIKSLSFCFLLSSLFPATALELPALTFALENGDVSKITASMLKSLNVETINATYHGETHTYTGVSLLSALKAAGMKISEPMRGADLATVIRVSASDNYQVVFSLGELAPTLGNSRIYLAYEADEAPLPASIGPWRLVVADDIRGARSVHSVKGFEVLVLKKPAL